MTETVHPDLHATGFLPADPNPLRYDNHSTDPCEVGGMLAALAPKNARILDVGCGTGSLAKIIMEASRSSLVGIEPDENRAATARSRGIDVHVGLLTEELLPQLGSFDAVIFADVLEHVPDPTGLVALARRTLRPGGCVLISVPNVAHWSVRIDLLRGRFDYEPCGIMDATHLRWFTAKTIRRVVEAAGLQVEFMGQTAGTGLGSYARRPWRWMGHSFRNKLIHGLLRIRPTLFGCQHIVKARLPAAAGRAPAISSNGSH